MFRITQNSSWSLQSYARKIVGFFFRSIYLSIYLFESVCLSVSLSLYIYVSALSPCLSFCLCLCLCRSVPLSRYIYNILASVCWLRVLHKIQSAKQQLLPLSVFILPHCHGHKVKLGGGPLAYECTTEGSVKYCLVSVGISSLGGASGTKQLNFAHFRRG